MKNLILIILLFQVTTVFAQSKHGFETGVDSLALNHHIKRKIIHYVDSDTFEIEMYSYSETGFLLKYEMNKVLPEGNNHGLVFTGQEHVTCEFIYNESGYLIGELYNSGSPALMGYTLYQQDAQRTTVDTYENGVLRKSVTTSKTIDKDDSTVNGTYTITIDYDEQGRITQLDGGTWKDVYTYGENGLLMEMLSIYRDSSYRTLYAYEFYDLN